jgi:hypothetical protein
LRPFMTIMRPFAAIYSHFAAIYGPHTTPMYLR